MYKPRAENMEIQIQGEKRRTGEEIGRDTRYQSQLVKLKLKLRKSGKNYETWPLDTQPWAFKMILTFSKDIV